MLCETDICTEAHPTGVYGMCNSMDSEIEGSALDNKGLKPLDPYTRVRLDFR